jgi:hypothetical protein
MNKSQITIDTQAELEETLTIMQEIVSGGLKKRDCLRSGMCCKTIPCAFGEWDATKHQCRFLEETEVHPEFTIYACGKKAEIEALPASYGASINPAFGAGCCMPLFNANRATIRKHRGVKP